MRSWGLLLACLALGACADLSPIEAGVCGNEVLEPGEDCDVHTDSTLGKGLRCGECRYVCEADTSCPLGWDCGTDGTCRRASNDLISGPSAPGWLPTSFEPLDFDGDGHVDLVGGFADRIEFRPGDAAGSFLTGFTLPTLPVTGDVAVGQLDSDLRADVLLPTTQGLLVWRGQAEGPPLQAPYAAIGIVAPGVVWAIPMAFPSIGPEGLFVAVFAGGGQIIARIVASGKRYDEIEVGKGMIVDEVGERVAVANFDPDQINDSGDDIAFGFPGWSQVKIYRARHDYVSSDFILTGFGSPSPTVVDVSQPRLCDGCGTTKPGMQIDRGVQTVDVNGDGNLDLLVSVIGSTSDTSAVVVARGDGKGGFEPAYLDGRFGALGKLSQWPIAAGDLNADGVADYVSPSGVFTASPTDPYELTQTDSHDNPEPWTAATLSDVDGDQTVDIVAIAEHQPFVDVLRCESGESSCTTTGRFARARYPTKLGVTKMRTGRLQGLKAMDLALLESSPDGTLEDDAVSVMYAQPSAWPDLPVRVARFQRIRQLEIEHYRLPIGPKADPFEDVLVSTVSAEVKMSFGILFANGLQQLSSPFLLTTDADSSNPEYSTGERALVGRFSEEQQAHDDLVLLGQTPGNRPLVWSVPGAEEAAFAPTEISKSLSDELGKDFNFGCARFTAGDFDADGRDEVLIVFGHAVCAKDYSDSKVFAGVTKGSSIAFQELALEIADGADGALITASDLDGDGSAELVLARMGSASVYRGGPGGLASTPSLFELPATEVVLDVTPIARKKKAGGANRVALLTDSSVIILSADAVATTLERVSSQRLRSADVDGDGLGDLLLSGTGGVDVLLTVPASPLGSSR